MNNRKNENGGIFTPALLSTNMPLAVAQTLAADRVRTQQSPQSEFSSAHLHQHRVLYALLSPDSIGAGLGPFYFPRTATRNWFAPEPVDGCTHV